MNLHDLIMKRRSVRNFTDQEIPEPIIEALLDAANNAPTGGNIQPLSVILVQEAERRKHLAAMVGGQPWAKNAPLSMIFCLDFYRVKRWASLFGTKFMGESALAHFLIAYADVMCAAENVVLLAESYGLGSVYVGTIQSAVDEARDYFEIPPYVLPVIVLSLGYPRSVPANIPKLQRDAITHRERYRTMSDAEIKQVYEEKYGDFADKAEKYLERAFVEVVEADKQGDDNWIEAAKDEMKRLQIRNNAQFLFELRYPAERMVELNEELIHAFANAGFDCFTDLAT